MKNTQQIVQHNLIEPAQQASIRLTLQQHPL